MAQLSYVAYRQLRADFIDLPFTPALRFCSCGYFAICSLLHTQSLAWLNYPTSLIDSYGQISSICPSLRLCAFAPVGISPFARYCIRSRSHGSIILRRLSTVTGRFHRSALHSGFALFLLKPIKHDISVLTVAPLSGTECCAPAAASAACTCGTESNCKTFGK